MNKQFRFFCFVLFLFFMALLSSWIFGPESIIPKVIFYSYLVFSMLLAWGAKYIVKGNVDLIKKLNQK